MSHQTCQPHRPRHAPARARRGGKQGGKRGGSTGGRGGQAGEAPERAREPAHSTHKTSDPGVRASGPPVRRPGAGRASAVPLHRTLETSVADPCPLCAGIEKRLHCLPFPTRPLALSTDTAPDHCRPRRSSAPRPPASRAHMPAATAPRTHKVAGAARGASRTSALLPSACSLVARVLLSQGTRRP